MKQQGFTFLGDTKANYAPSLYIDLLYMYNNSIIDTPYPYSFSLSSVKSPCIVYRDYWQYALVQSNKLNLISFSILNFIIFTQ